MKGRTIWRRLVVSMAILFLPVTGLLAQSVSDAITQLLLDVQKLTQLKQLLSDMQKGYTVISKGYEAIKYLSRGTFSLHKEFLDGLMAVSPVVSNYVKVGDIVSKEAMLVQEYRTANQYFRRSGRFTVQELDYFSRVYANLFDASLKNINELVMVITAGELRMSDAERLAAVDRIDQNITGQLNFLTAFDNQAAMQVMQRAKGMQEVGSLRWLYGLGP